jgi:hypothetical protein
MHGIGRPGSSSRSARSPSTNRVMLGRSSASASGRSTQAISSSSPQSGARSRLSSALASAMKKRASNRLGRYGGVIARATNVSADRSGAAPSARNGRQGPTPGRGAAGFASSNPASSNVSRTAANASARGSAGRRSGAVSASFAATSGRSSAAAGARASPRSTPPPGNTHLPGMKSCPRLRRPISTRGCGPSRRTTISVAASRGRTAAAPALRIAPSVAGS